MTKFMHRSNNASIAPKPNNTGLPDNLKSGIESLSGLSMDNVRVHYNSPQPAQLNALAYAQGTNIHIAPGQEEHLPHEAWHVVQQAQGRVQPTMQMKTGVPINDDKELEQEADVMGGKATQLKELITTSDLTSKVGLTIKPFEAVDQAIQSQSVIQLVKNVIQNIPNSRVGVFRQRVQDMREQLAEYNSYPPEVAPEASAEKNINESRKNYK